MYILYAAIVILLIFIFETNKKEFYKWKRNIEFATSLPGASIFTSFVNALQIACNKKELLHYVESITKKYGNLTHFIIGTELFVIVAKPEDYKLVFKNVHGIYKSSVTATWDALIGDGILRASGETHRIRRKLIQTFLNIKYLSEYVTFFDIYSKFCADTLKKKVDGSTFDLKPYIARYTFDIYLAVMSGIHDSKHKRDCDKLIYWQEKLFKDAYSKMIKPWLQFEWIVSLTKSGKEMYIAQDNTLDFIYNILPQNEANHTTLPNNNEISQNSMILQKSKSVSEKYWNHVEELRNNITSKSCEVSDKNFIDDVRSLYATIQGTITELISFIILMLAMHTEVQEKLREEIFVIFNNNEINAERLRNMRYFHMIYQETLRLFPVAPVVIRQLTGDIKLESSTLPDGCCVLIPIMAVHRNPAYWHEPLKFIPERFSSECLSNHHHYTYLPFGMGARDCVGQRFAYLSVATIFVNLMKQYRFVNNISNINDVKISNDLILRAENVRLSMTPI